MLAFGWWARGLSLLTVLAIVLGIVALVSVLRDARMSGGARLLWVVAILFLPIFGSAIYVGVRNDW